MTTAGSRSRIDEMGDSECDDVGLLEEQPVPEDEERFDGRELAEGD
jgi:hypothetical protein